MTSKNCVIKNSMYWICDGQYKKLEFLAGWDPKADFLSHVFAKLYQFDVVRCTIFTQNCGLGNILHSVLKTCVLVWIILSITRFWIVNIGRYDSVMLMVWKHLELCIFLYRHKVIRAFSVTPVWQRPMWCCGFFYLFSFV